MATSATRGERPRSRYDLSLGELAALLEGEPAFRARQLHDGLYRHLAEPDELTVLPRALRERLRGVPELSPALRTERELQADRSQTTKWLFALHDGQQVETVLMHYPRHSTVCVSSQVGCAMACQFCATGDLGFSRHLSAGEIIEQVVHAARAARAVGRRLDHVVFMGMGEPLANVAPVRKALEGLVSDLGFAARHLTVSTVGILPGIRQLCELPLQVNLAVSLHAANDDLRDRLVPINRRYPLSALHEALEEYRSATSRRISFEWALMAEVNDRPRDADELAAYATSLGAHVNLIPMNPTEGGSARGLRGSPPERVRKFRDLLANRGVNVTVRRTRGQSIDAACGQLAGATARANPAGQRGTDPIDLRTSVAIGTRARR